jgi:DNA-binding NtrC family response regulator
VNVLLVDDDPDTLDLLRSFFESNGHRVTAVPLFQQAWKAVVEAPFDFVLSDIRLPDGDGLDLLRKIKEVRPRLPVVIMTGFKEAEVVVEAFRRGAMDCLLKPLNLAYLKDHILSRVGL